MGQDNIPAEVQPEITVALAFLKLECILVPVSPAKAAIFLPGDRIGSRLGIDPARDGCAIGFQAPKRNVIPITPINNIWSIPGWSEKNDIVW